MALSEGLAYFGKQVEDEKPVENLGQQNANTNDKDKSPDHKRPANVRNKESLSKKQSEKRSKNHSPTSKANEYPTDEP
jgi:hypothetical protein